MLLDEDGENINGPSLIQVPEWLPAPLGRYYLYFAHHGGSYIRLAYADDLTGPWTVHEPGTLRLEQTPFHGHIASPDVHIDHECRRLRMYYHGCLADDEGRWQGQFSAMALSEDGLHFVSDEQIIGPSYMRMFTWDDWWYSLAMPGCMLRSRDGLGVFEQGPQVFEFAETHIEKLRHAALLLRGDTLRVFYSRAGDTPEHIMYSDIALKGDWSTWHATEPATILQPETPHEGVDLPLTASTGGRAHGPVRQLRDPAVYEDGHQAYLLYSVAGESGIAIARLQD